MVRLRPIRRPIRRAELPGRAAEPPPPVVLLTLTHPRIGKLMKELAALEREGGQRDADNRAAIGKLLGEAQASLERGDWLTFVAEHTPYTQRSAHRYMALHHFSVDQPASYHDLRHLGASKLYLIASLADEPRRKLIRRRTHAVPGRRRRLQLEEMTYHELLGLLFSRRLEGSVSKAAKSFDRRVKGLGKATNALVSQADALDKDAAKAWCEALRNAADLLAEACDLEA